MAIITNPPLPAEGWEIHYKDNSIVSSLSSTWEEAPSEGVLVVIIWHNPYKIGTTVDKDGKTVGYRSKTLLTGVDYYMYVDENHWGTSDEWLKVKEHPYKRGVWTTDEHMEGVYRVAFEKLDIG